MLQLQRKRQQRKKGLVADKPLDFVSPLASITMMKGKEPHGEQVCIIQQALQRKLGKKPPITSSFEKKSQHTLLLATHHYHHHLSNMSVDTLMVCTTHAQLLAQHLNTRMHIDI